VLVLIVDAAKNAMAGDYRSITDGSISVLKRPARGRRHSTAP